MKRPRCQSAFTLVELLIATAITTILVVMLGQTLATTTSVYSLADQRMDAFRDAKASLQLMTTDFSRANLNGDPQMMTLANSPSNTYATEAYAVAPVKNKGKGDLCAIGYYLDWDGGSKTYSLRRFIKNSDVTATSLAKSPVDFGTLYDRTNNANPENIASYVWDLEFRPGQGQNMAALGSTNSQQWNWIEIRFKAMSVKAGRKIAKIGAISKSTWDDPSTPEYKRYILPNEQQFVTRVSLFQTQ